MKKIKFDEHGLIRPPQIITLSLEELERIFVTEQVEVTYRQQIFQQYLLFNQAVEKEIGRILFQFVNGSFTTQKPKPQDLDVVSFLDYRLYRKEEKTIEAITQKWNQLVELDVYIIPRSYPGHTMFIQSQLMYEYWKNLFSFTREDNTGKRLPKGLIKIEYYD